MLTRTLTTVAIPTIGMAFIFRGAAHVKLAYMRRRAVRRRQLFCRHAENWLTHARQILASALGHEEALQ